MWNLKMELLYLAWQRPVASYFVSCRVVCRVSRKRLNEMDLDEDIDTDQRQIST